MCWLVVRGLSQGILDAVYIDLTSSGKLPQAACVPPFPPVQTDSLVLRSVRERPRSSFDQGAGPGQAALWPCKGNRFIASIPKSDLGGNFFCHKS